MRRYIQSFAFVAVSVWGNDDFRSVGRAKPVNAGVRSSNAFKSKLGILPKASLEIDARSIGSMRTSPPPPKPAQSSSLSNPTSARSKSSIFLPADVTPPSPVSINQGLSGKTRSAPGGDSADKSVKSTYMLGNGPSSARLNPVAQLPAVSMSQKTTSARSANSVHASMVPGSKSTSSSQNTLSSIPRSSKFSSKGSLNSMSAPGVPQSIPDGPPAMSFRSSRSSQIIPKSDQSTGFGSMRVSDEQPMLPRVRGTKSGPLTSTSHMGSFPSSISFRGKEQVHSAQESSASDTSEINQAETKPSDARELSSQEIIRALATKLDKAASDPAVIEASKTLSRLAAKAGVAAARQVAEELN